MLDFPAFSLGADVKPRPARVVKEGTKVRLAFVGLGGMGKQQVERFMQTEKVEPVGFCDVDWREERGARGAATLIKKYPDVPRYYDFRKMLVELDDKIDAVCVATPDHMHFLPAYMAMPHGQARLRREAAHPDHLGGSYSARSRPQGRSLHADGQSRALQRGVRRLKEWVQAGVIGNVKEIHIWTNRLSWPRA